MINKFNQASRVYDSFKNGVQIGTGIDHYTHASDRIANAWATRSPAGASTINTIDRWKPMITRASNFIGIPTKDF